MPNKVITTIVKRRQFDTEDLISLLILIIVLSALFLGSLGLYRNIRSANETKAALCIFKYDIITRRDANQKILLDNPDKEKIFGIPREVIETNIELQTATIASLRVLNCPQDHRQGG